MTEHYSRTCYKALYRSHHSNYPGCHHGCKIEVSILFYNGNREVFIYREYYCKPNCLTGCIKTKPLKFEISTRFSINLTALNFLCGVSFNDSGLYMVFFTLNRPQCITIQDGVAIDRLIPVAVIGSTLINSSQRNISLFLQSQCQP